jgi:hypothetical protein
MKRNINFTKCFSITAILSIVLFVGCVSKENIKVPVSDPPSHPKLAQMQSLSIEEKKESHILERVRNIGKEA